MDGLMEWPYLTQQPYSHKGRKGEGGEGADWLIERKAAATVRSKGASETRMRVYA